MKRWIFKLVVFLLLGTIVNVAVAWGCGAWLNTLGGEQVGRINSMDSPRWAILINTRLGATRVTCSRVDEPYKVVPHMPLGRAPYWSRGRLSPDQVSLQYRQVGSIMWHPVDEARGWPLRAMMWWADMKRDHSTGTTLAVTVEHGLDLSNLAVMPEFTRALPVKPIWPGFAINTTFYAAILWLPFALRRYVRVKRGHCIKCAYDLRGTEHEVCPECGVEV